MCGVSGDGPALPCRFSALQRAENSSIFASSSPRMITPSCFSALQRAENSSIRNSRAAATRAPAFQCSSASRKFLNLVKGGVNVKDVLFQCSSASRKFLNADGVVPRAVREDEVSVLFSEPKIPQYRRRGHLAARRTLFQCSSASRKFLNGTRCDLRIAKIAVSVLFSEPKIPQYRRRRRRGTRCRRVSVLFSEPKIPQSAVTTPALLFFLFQCSSASRKFLN